MSIKLVLCLAFTPVHRTHSMNGLCLHARNFRDLKVCQFCLKIITFQKNLSEIPSKCPTIWIPIKPEILSSDN